MCATSVEMDALPPVYGGFKKLEQFAARVVNYSSKYNAPESLAYGPENLVGLNGVYPNYGDYPDTYNLRTYGRWWNESEAAQKHYMPQDIESLISEDFVTLRFETAVIPTSIIVYETYNPGAVVRIWGRYVGEHWRMLYEGPPQQCEPEARKFSPKLREYYHLINEVRLEFNQSHLEYHTSIDAILLIGYSPKTELQMRLVQNGFIKTPGVDRQQQKPQIADGIDDSFTIGDDLFSKLPYEVIFRIFEYLDLKSLCRCAQVSKRWYCVTLDPELYRGLSLKKYWHLVDDDVIRFFTKRCRNMRKLDLSWCSKDFIKKQTLNEFLTNCGQQLTHLSLRNCDAIDDNSIGVICTFENITDLRLKNVQLTSIGNLGRSKLTKLVTLDLYGTSIMEQDLIEILRKNPNLHHLILDLCASINDLDVIAETVSTFNTNLVTWSSWKTSRNSMSSYGIKHLAKCTNLHELDVGWCLMMSDPVDCLEKIAFGCRDLKRLGLSQWRSLSDRQLAPILYSCKKLIQLDLMGVMNITNESCERALANLPNLQVLDIAYCSLVQRAQVALWKEQYPNVKIHFNSLSIY